MLSIFGREELIILTLTLERVSIPLKSDHACLNSSWYTWIILPPFCCADDLDKILFSMKQKKKKKKKKVKTAVFCSCDWRFKGYYLLFVKGNIDEIVPMYPPSDLAVGKWWNTQRKIFIIFYILETYNESFQIKNELMTWTTSVVSDKLSCLSIKSNQDTYFFLIVLTLNIRTY